MGFLRPWGTTWHSSPVDHQKSDYGGRSWGARKGNLSMKKIQHKFAVTGRNGFCLAGSPLPLLLHPSFQGRVYVSPPWFLRFVTSFFGSLPCSECSRVSMVCWLCCDFLTPVPVSSQPSESGKFLPSRPASPLLSVALQAHCYHCLGGLAQRKALSKPN